MKVWNFLNCMCIRRHHLIRPGRPRPAGWKSNRNLLHIHIYTLRRRNRYKNSDDRKINSHTNTHTLHTHSHTTRIANIEKKIGKARSAAIKAAPVFEALWSTTLKAAGHFAAPATLTRESSALFSMCFFCSWGRAGQTCDLHSRYLPLYVNIYINKTPYVTLKMWLLLYCRCQSEVVSIKAHNIIAKYLLFFKCHNFFN
jgi:hypothetical protein